VTIKKISGAKPASRPYQYEFTGKWAFDPAEKIPLSGAVEARLRSKNAKTNVDTTHFTGWRMP
jgi:hypothetical protein